MILATNDHESSALILPALQEQGLEVSMVASLEELPAVLLLGQHSLVVIDSRFAGQRLSSLVRLVPVDNGVQVLVLLNCDDPESGGCHEAYEVGAVGCFQKPYVPRDVALLARNLNKIGSNPCSQAISGLNEWTYSISSCRFTSPSGIGVHMKNKEVLLFEKLAKDCQRPISREETRELLGYPDTMKGDKALEAVVHRLRAKLAVIEPDMIETVHGFGWKLVVPVMVV